MNKTILQKLQLENFKCYKKATINFKNLTILVGENNAGKSCLIESLRLVSRVAQGSTQRTYIPAPEEFNLPATTRGFRIDTQKLKIDLRVIIYFYNSSNFAKITAYFFNKSKIEIYLNQYLAFAVLYDPEQNVIKSKQQALKSGINKLNILPQIGPIRENEKLLAKDTVSSDKDTYLSSLHFRNEINLWKDEYFQDFKRISESTWMGLRVNSLEFNITESEYMSLIVQDNNFAAEIGKMGSGIQMWLQIMWFLARSKNCDVIILDEPDVYMHSDMQRKLLEIVKTNFPQVIIATHSLEIISRVDPEFILEINKKDKTMRYATDSASAQKIIDDIGGVQNLALLKLGRSRKCLFVEGKDVPLLNQFNECLYGKQLDLPTIPFGGFNNIPRVYGTANLFFNETTNQIKCFALADKDYRDERIINKVYEDAKREHVNLHVWSKKEIENYLLVPKILYKFIPSDFNLAYDDFLQLLNDLLETQKDAVFDSYSSQYRNDCKALSNGQQWEVATCNQHAREYLTQHWINLENKLSLIGGKDFLSFINGYFKEHFNVSLSVKKILQKFTPSSVPKEISDFLAQLQ